jgi:hypothetical protein
LFLLDPEKRFYLPVSVIEPDDDDGHVVTAVLAVVAHRLGAAHVQNLKSKFIKKFFGEDTK